MILTEAGWRVSRLLLLILTATLCCALEPAIVLAQDRGPQASGPPAVPLPAGSLVVEVTDAALSSALRTAIVDPRFQNLNAVAVRYQQIGVLDKAMDYYTDSLRRNPSGVTALDGVARIWRAWGELGLALGSAYRAVHSSPRSPEAWNTLGTILHDVGNFSAASDTYMRARSLDSSASYVAANLCYLALVQGQADRALGECSMALALDQSQASTWNNLGLLYAATGDHARAAETFKAAGDPAAAQYNIGIVLMSPQLRGRGSRVRAGVTREAGLLRCLEHGRVRPEAVA